MVWVWVLLVAPLVLCISLIVYGAAGYYRLNEQPFWVFWGMIGLVTVFVGIAGGLRYVNEEPRPVPVVPLKEKETRERTLEADWPDARENRNLEYYRVAVEESLQENHSLTEQQMRALAIAEDSRREEGIQLVLWDGLLLLGSVGWMVLLLCAWRVGYYMRPKLLADEEKDWDYGV
ncbi:MAG: hypothetical protein Q4D98_00945 [Planctomycetia bacterium]|nr:hypothetical protein [Planctomycetia bacterium]